MRRKMYQYLVKLSDIKSLVSRIRYITQPPGPRSFAKAKLINIIARVKSGKLKPDNNGNIIISASDGDTINKAVFGIKMEMVDKTENVDTTDYWWNNI